MAGGAVQPMAERNAAKPIASCERLLAAIPDIPWRVTTRGNLAENLRFPAKTGGYIVTGTYTHIPRC